MDEKIAILTDTNSGINPDQAAQYGNSSGFNAGHHR